MKKKQIVIIISVGMLIFLIGIVFFHFLNKKGEIISYEEQPPSTVAIQFNYQKQLTYSSNQFAIWIEDLKGNLIKTVYVTSFTANGGYKKREDSLPIWVQKSNIKDANQEQIDSISGATPKSGSLMYIWDQTDESGRKVVKGKYTFLVEVTAYKENRILFKGVVDTESEQMPIIAQAEYTTEVAKGNNILSNVRATYKK